LACANNVSVLAMLQSLLSPNDGLKPLHSQLSSIGFVRKLTRQIEKHRIAGVQGDRLSALYRIGVWCAQNFRMRKVVMAPSMIAVLLERRDHDEPDVRSARCELLRELVSGETVCAFQPLLVEAIGEVQGTSAVCVATALEFWTAMLRVTGSVASGVTVEALVAAIACACAANPQCSVLLNAAARAIVAGLSRAETRRAFAEGLLDFVATAARDRTERVLSAFMVDCARRVTVICEDDDDLRAVVAGNRDFWAVCQNEVAAFEAGLDADYGTEAQPDLVADAVDVASQRVSC